MFSMFLTVNLISSTRLEICFGTAILSMMDKIFLENHSSSWYLLTSSKTCPGHFPNRQALRNKNWKITYFMPLSWIIFHYYLCKHNVIELFESILDASLFYLCQLGEGVQLCLANLMLRLRWRVLVYYLWVIC